MKRLDKITIYHTIHSNGPISLQEHLKGTLEPDLHFNYKNVAPVLFPGPQIVLASNVQYLPMAWELLG